MRPSLARALILAAVFAVALLQLTSAAPLARRRRLADAAGGWVTMTKGGDPSAAASAPWTSFVPGEAGEAGVASTAAPWAAYVPGEAGEALATGRR